MYNYVKALHLIFVVTWFSGLFYVVRLFIYHTEAHERPAPESQVLEPQLALMTRRLWLGITWPSALLTLIFGVWEWMNLGSFPLWLQVKVAFVAGLYGYHLSLHYIYQSLQKKRFLFTSQQLRIWNEVATVFLVAIVFLAAFKEAMSWARGLIGLAGLIFTLLAAIRIYKKVRKKSA